jgi:dihydroorotase
MPLLATLFEGYGKLDKLEAFTSEYGARWYGLPLNSSILELEKKSFLVPSSDTCEGVVPFMAGETLSWSVV